MTLQDALQKYLQDKIVYAESETVRFYNEAIGFYVSWLEKNDIYLVESLENKDLLSLYVVYLRSVRRIKATSIRSYFRGIMNFYTWLKEKQLIPSGCYKVKLPKSDPDIVMPLTNAEVDSILEAIKLHSQYVLRDILIFRLMLDCGLRSSEVRHLQVNHVDLENRLLRIIKSKGNKSRVVPVPDVVLQHIKDYLADRPEVKCQALLLNKSNEELSENSIKLFFSKLKLCSSVDRVHAHLLRHTFATSYMMTHNNIEYLRIYMGHESYDVTRNYIHIASQCMLTHYDCYRIDDCFV